MNRYYCQPWLIDLICIKTRYNYANVTLYNPLPTPATVHGPRARAMSAEFARIFPAPLYHPVRSRSREVSRDLFEFETPSREVRISRIRAISLLSEKTQDGRVFITRAQFARFFPHRFIARSDWALTRSLRSLFGFESPPRSRSRKVRSLESV